MKENTIDNWVLVMSRDLETMAHTWAEALGQALNGGNAGELDSVVERLKANTIDPETTAENAAEQIARLAKWRVKLLKVSMATDELVKAMMAIATGIDALGLRIADAQYAEIIELDYLPKNPQSLAGDRWRADENQPKPPSPPDDWDKDRDTNGNGRRPRFY